MLECFLIFWASTVPAWHMLGGLFLTAVAWNQLVKEVWIVDAWLSTHILNNYLCVCLKLLNYLMLIWGGQWVAMLMRFVFVENSDSLSKGFFVASN